MKRIRELIHSNRTEQNRTLEELSAFLNVPLQALVDFENGHAALEAETVFGLVNALNIDPEEFLKLLNLDDVGSDVELLRARLGKS